MVHAINPCERLKFTPDDIQFICETYIRDGHVNNIKGNPRLLKRKNKVVGNTTLHRILKANGIKILNRWEIEEKYRIIRDDQLDTIKDMYLNKNISACDIGKKYGCNHSVVIHFLKLHNIPIRKVPEKKLSCRDLDGKLEQIKALYASKGNIKDCAEVLGTSLIILRRFFLKHNMPYKQRIRREWTADEIDQIRKLYVDEKLTPKQIGKQFGVCQMSIDAVLVENNIPKRDINDIRMENSAKAGKPRPYSLPSGAIVKLRGYEPKFLDFVFANNIFKEDEIMYTVSTIPKIPYACPIDGRKRMYMPDFYVPKHNLIIEIKAQSIIDRLQTPENAKAKEAATRSLGYNFVMVLDNNFEPFIEYMKQFAK